MWRYRFPPGCKFIIVNIVLIGATLKAHHGANGHLIRERTVAGEGLEHQQQNGE